MALLEPLVARAGAVIPSSAAVSYEGQRRLDTLSIDVYPGSATSELYEDAGEGYAYQRGEYRRTTFTTAAAIDVQGIAPRLSVALAQTGSYPGAGSFKVTIHDVSRPQRTLVDGRSAQTVYDGPQRELHFVIPSRTRRLQIE